VFNATTKQGEQMKEQDKITIDLPDAGAIGAEVATVSGGAAVAEIRDDAERMAVSERIGQCKRVLKQINELFKGAKKAASDAHKAVCAAERKLSDPVDAWIRQAGQKVLAYDAEKDRIRMAEEARLQAEAQAKADAERRRLEAIAARCKDEEKKAAYEDAAQAVQVVVPHIAAPENKAAGEVKSVRWVAELTDLTLLCKAAAGGRRERYRLPRVCAVFRRSIGAGFSA
jgi:hypothetical protein